MPKAKVGEITINYKVEGQGEPLIMIMGFAGRCGDWRFQTRAFKKYYQIITFDNRGAGKTDKPDGPYTIRMMADDTVGLMDNLAIDRAHILGISMGGMIAQEIAINHPDRVKKLVLGSTHAGGQSVREEVARVSPELLEAADTLDSGHAGIQKVLSTITMQSFSNNNRHWKIIIALLVRIKIIFGGTKGLMGHYEAVQTHDTLDRLHLIEAPTLVVTGTADRVIPSALSDLLASRIPDARLVKIENGSHALSFKMKGRFNQEVLDFLSGTLPVALE